MGIQFDGINNEIKSQTKIDFPGSIGIAGTLTYEDVTSVDSIGIITARTGVIVGSGVTLNATGVIATGVVTATSFSGSGANLTSLPAANLTGTLPAISGANLTSLPAQATIANNADNRIITGGSGVNLNGETSGTFSSGQLKILTDGASGSGIRLVGKSSNSGAEIDFYNNADNSLQGYIEFSDAGSRFWNLTNTDIHFRTNNTERLRILAGGGLTFNGDTASANALDDYEEGTYVPTTNTGLTLQSSYDIFAYIKVGRMCTVRGLFYPNNNPSGNYAMTFSLPFGAYNYTQIAGAGGSSVMHRLISGASNGVSVYVEDGGTIAKFYKNGGSGNWGPVYNTDWNSAMEIYVDFTYFTV